MEAWNGFVTLLLYGITVVSGVGEVCGKKVSVTTARDDMGCRCIDSGKSCEGLAVVLRIIQRGLCAGA